MTIASVSFLATCYWVNALACKAGGDNLTVEAPRHEAGFRVIFGPQNDALQMGYGAGSTDRPGPRKFPSKMKLENVFSSESYTVHKIRSGSFAKFCTQLV